MKKLIESPLTAWDHQSNKLCQSCISETAERFPESRVSRHVFYFIGGLFMMCWKLNIVVTLQIFQHEMPFILKLILSLSRWNIYFVGNSPEVPICNPAVIFYSAVTLFDPMLQIAVILFFF